MRYQDLLQQEFLGNPAQDIVRAAIIFCVVFVLLKLFRTIVITRVQKIAQKTSLRVDDTLIEVLSNIGWFFCFAVSLFIASKSVVLHDIAHMVIYSIFMIAVVYEVISVVQKIILFFVHKVWMKDHANEEHVTHVLGLIIKLVLWSVGLLLVLSNLGFEISSLLASLGIGGVAVALAVQNILGDMFSSFSIYFDRPFEVGDFIIVGDHMGTVQKIGLKTTRIRALQGEEIVMSNSELTSARIRNFKKMQKRRIVFGFGVTYDTATEKLRAIPDMVKGVIDPVQNADFDRAHFKSFNDSSLDYEVVYYVETGDYTEYMNIQQEINIGIMEAFTNQKIEMAFPTRTVHLVK